MRRTDRDKHAALGQFIGLLLIIAILTGASLWETEQPADATRLSLPMSELRSQSAEVQAMGDERAAGRIGDGFAAAHAQQLLENQRDTQDELAKLLPWPELAPLQRDALRDAALLQQKLAQAAENDERDIDALRDRFRKRERELRD
jgi:hypothetical protein